MELTQEQIYAKWKRGTRAVQDAKKPMSDTTPLMLVIAIPTFFLFMASGVNFVAAIPSSLLIAALIVGMVAKK